MNCSKLFHPKGGGIKIAIDYHGVMLLIVPECSSPEHFSCFNEEKNTYLLQQIYNNYNKKASANAEAP